MRKVMSGTCSVLSGAGARCASFTRDMIEPFLRFPVERVAFLFSAKGFRVIEATTIDKPRWMFDMQHLVIEDVLDKPFGPVRGVERLADHDGVVDGIVVAENAARAARRPSERRLLKCIVQITPVEACEQSIQIVISAARRRDQF